MEASTELKLESVLRGVNKKYKKKVAVTEWLSTYGYEDDELEEANTFLNWVGDKEQFFELMEVTTRSQRDTLTSKPKQTDFYRVFNMDMPRETARSNIEGYITFINQPKKKEYYRYDVTTYKLPKEVVKLLAEHKYSETLFDEPGADIKYNIDHIEAQSREYHQADTIKNEDSSLSSDQRRTLNDKKHAALEIIKEHINQIKAAMAERAKKAQYIADVMGEDAAIQALPAYPTMAANPLALNIWRATVQVAGKSGYLQESGNIHPATDVIAAMVLLKRLSKQWEDSYAKTRYLTEPHVPGTGHPQNKTGHSNPESRASLWQADFITTWGGDKTVMHVNSEKPT